MYFEKGTICTGFVRTIFLLYICCEKILFLFFFLFIHHLAIFVFKGYVAYSLWKERDGAVGLAQIDAWIGIVACVVMMIYSMFVQSNSSIVFFTLRFELLFLIPYVWVMNRIAYDWG